jgi:ABC-type multidrug transport system fused ATPase/permease subunit
VQFLSAGGYLFAAWYLSEISPSTYSVSKPANFVLRTSPFSTIASHFNSLQSRFDRSRNSYTPLLTNTVESYHSAVAGPNRDIEMNISTEMNPIISDRPEPYQTMLSASTFPNTCLSNDDESESKENNELSTSQNVFPPATNSETVYLSEPLSECLSSQQPTVRISGLRKTYDQNMVVKNIALSLYENSVFALLGHKGAGKVSSFLFMKRPC